MNFSKKLNRKLTILAYYQIFGGVGGLLLFLYALAQLGTITGLVMLLMLIMISLYLFSIYCGRKILANEIRLGLQLSIVNQAIQIFSFNMLGYGFKFVSGIGLLVGFDFQDGFNFRFNFQFSNSNIQYAVEDDLVALMVNIVAIYLIQYISELKEDIKEYREMELAAETFKKIKFEEN